MDNICYTLYVIHANSVQSHSQKTESNICVVQNVYKMQQTEEGDAKGIKLQEGRNKNNKNSSENKNF